MRIKRYKAALLSICLLISGFFLTGSIFNLATVTLDTNNNKVYQNMTFDDIAEDYLTDPEGAGEKYNGGYYAVRGRIALKNEGNTSITLRCIDINQSGRLICTTSNTQIIGAVSEMDPGENVVVYGKLSTPLFGEDLQLSIDNISESNKDIPQTVYSLKNGKSMDSDNMESRTLGEGKIEYKIPASWADVEHNIKEEKLGTIDGCQYRLNEISGSASVRPESFFVCYFDNSLLSDPNDRKHTDSIERTIISNILGKEVNKLKAFPSKWVNTYYGSRYQYYDDKYSNSSGEGYHTEFVFQQNGTDGIVVYIYVYKDKNHIDDVFFVMNMLDIK